MKTPDMFRIKPFLDLLATSKISILGAVLVTTAVGCDVMLILGELFIFETNPYIGIVAYVLFPGMAVFGLVLIPVGMLLVIRKSSRDPVGKVIRRVRAKHVFQLITSLTLINFVIFAFVGYRSIHFMESAEFCGVTCHQVMSPEYTVYQRSHHSGVACVECHVGPGVGWLIKSKLDGTRQLAGVIMDNYSRPIATPVHNMRPAEHICGECHSKESYQGNRIKVNEHYESDEANTRTFSIVNLRLGEPEHESDELRGIHWHNNENHELRFWSTDHKREHVVRVELLNEDGEKRVWTRQGSESESLGDEHLSGSHSEMGSDELTQASDSHLIERLMDCVDCHNRPTHVFLPPDKALDDLLADGTIDPQIPWIRSLAYELITKEYETDDEAMNGIAELPDLYRERHEDQWAALAEALEDVVPILQELHAIYVYPEMNIEWNTYPSRIGHPTAHTSACFRCHGGLLVDAQGVQITNDCNACHHVLAEDEQDPMILRMLGDQ